jgi:MFS family permease
MPSKQKLPKSIWILGFVSMFMDISSEMVHGLVPVFLVSVIGANAMTVGFIEGFGEGLALIIRVFSGTLSDRLGKRKIIIVSGYLMGTLTKPLFAVATGVGAVFTARSLDRIGKGLRGAPRDALIADFTPSHQRGSAYGLRQSLDSLGAVLGPLIAVALMILTSNDFRLIFWLAVIPGIIAVTILVIFVHEPETPPFKFEWKKFWKGNISGLGISFWIVIGLGIVFTLARFSEAFLLLRAKDIGASASMVPIMLVIMSLVYAIGAYPIGRLSDRIGRTGLLSVGLLVLIISDFVLAMATDIIYVSLGSALWGLHMALTQGLFAALVADTSGEKNRGTAFGIYGLVTGIAILVASVIAGWLWDQFGPPVTFYAGACFSLITLVGIFTLRKRVEIL